MNIKYNLDTESVFLTTDDGQTLEFGQHNPTLLLRYLRNDALAKLKPIRALHYAPRDAQSLYDHAERTRIKMAEVRSIHEARKAKELAKAKRRGDATKRHNELLKIAKELGL